MGYVLVDMSISIENIQEHIPYYLTKEAKDGLIKALKDFPEKMNYYAANHQNELLQGDGWSGLDIISLETTEKKSIKGIILSNSCDISNENIRDIPAHIVFAPIIPLASYENKLRTLSKITTDKIESKINSIKQQRITSLFYLPKGGYLDSEYIAVLDDLHTITVPYFHKRTDKQKLFTLSQVGFYIFLFKLSIHFCRFHENVLR